MRVGWKKVNVSSCEKSPSSPANHIYMPDPPGSRLSILETDENRSVTKCQLRSLNHLVDIQIPPVTMVWVEFNFTYNEG